MLDHLVWPREREAALRSLVEDLEQRVLAGDRSASLELRQARAELSLVASTGVVVGARGMDEDDGYGWR